MIIIAHLVTAVPISCCISRI